MKLPLSSLTSFSYPFKSGEVPLDWGQGNIVSIYKKGDEHKANNYRPVSLTSICSKIMEHIVVSNIRRVLNRYDILAEEQSQLPTFTQSLFNSVSGGGQVDTIVLDFSKAFDKVPHQRLMSKLDFYGISGDLHRLIEAFLTNRIQRVMQEGSISSSFKVLSGVFQGAVLGPILFLLYINDLSSYISSPVRLFTDDCVIYREIKNVPGCFNSPI